MLRKAIVSLFALAAMFAAAPFSQATADDAYPTKPVRVVVATGAGSAPDILARLIAANLEKQLGQPFVVENRPGGAGIIASQATLQAPADGYTILLNSTPFAINPSVRKKLPYDTFKDFTTVAATGFGLGYVLVVNPKLPVNNVKELIAYAKENRVLFGSPGFGNALHLAGEMFKARTGTQLEHVPYKGAGEALPAIVSGDIQMMFVSPTSSAPYIKNKLLRPIGFAGKKRLPALPDVPLVSDDIPGFYVAGWTAWIVRSETPKAITEKLNTALRKAVHDEKIAKTLRAGGYEPSDLSSAEAMAYFQKEASDWAEVVKSAGIEPR